MFKISHLFKINNTYALNESTKAFNY